MTRPTVCLLLFEIIGLSACSPTLHPSITVSTQNVNTLVINGQGFTPSNPCANLGLILPGNAPSAPIGQVKTCSNGAFQNVTWTPSYVYGCNPNQPEKVTVAASDIKFLNSAFAEASILWGPNCAIRGTCGRIGLRACPNPILPCPDGGGEDSTGNCVACGGEGQPGCTMPPVPPSTSPCVTGLHLDGIGNKAFCTAKCGNAYQNPCVTAGSTLVPPVTYQYHCYNGTTIGNDCVCVPTETANPCQEVNSGGTGVCGPFAKVPPGCQ
jgi:hypothetical protein